MSFPVLYDPDETSFYRNGRGVLSGCLSCKVTEERNGLYELEMRYPVDGLHYDQIQNRCLIRCKPNQSKPPQLFRVYSRSVPMSGVVTIRAAHISYDLSGVPVAPYSATNSEEAAEGIPPNCIIPYPGIGISTDIVSNLPFKIDTPRSVRQCLSDDDGFLATYGGEIEWRDDGIFIHQERGADRGVTVVYGNNLLDLRQEENCRNVCSGIYPYWKSKDEYFTLPIGNDIIAGDHNPGFTYVKAVDFSDKFDKKPSELMLRIAAGRYVRSNHIGIPDVSLKINFIQLSQTEEYKNLRLLEQVDLCDIVTVKFPEIGVSAKAKAVKVIYDVLMDRVDQIELGDARPAFVFKQTAGAAYLASQIRR